MSDANKNAVQDQQVVDESVPEQPRESSAPDTDRRRAVFFLAVGALLGGAGLLVSRPARADAGKCYLCGCCHYVGTSDDCNHCGHSYNDHTGRTCN